jgi:hypothetical protein
MGIQIQTLQCRTDGFQVYNTIKCIMHSQTYGALMLLAYEELKVYTVHQGLKSHICSRQIHSYQAMGL